MTASATKSLLDALLAAPRAEHPHLAPFNSHAFRRQHAIAIQGVEGLVAYQTFLADARAVKARRKRIEKTFERQVQRQSRQALADANLAISGALSATAQVNQTDFWQTLLRETSAGLESTGPTTMQDLWRDLRARPDVMSALSDLGITEAMATIADNAFASTQATLRSAAGHVEVAVGAPGGAGEFRTLLAPHRQRPRTVIDLIAAPSFDRLHSSFLRGDLALPAMGRSGTQCVPGDVVAFAAFAGQQFMVDHVRKLEDTGLATYAGGEPGTILVAMLIVGFVLFLAGLGIASLCRDDAPVIQPEPVCVAGSILTILGMAALIIAAGLLAVTFAAALGVTGLFALSVAAGAGELAMVYFLMLNADAAGAFDALGTGFTLEAGDTA